MATSAGHDILILERAEAFPVKALETLQRKGFAVRTVKETADAPAGLQALIEPILLVDCGSSPGTGEYLKTLLSHPQILDYPILLLGRDVDGLGETLSEHFALATTLRNPCTPAQVLEAVRSLCRVYRRGPPSGPEQPGAAQFKRKDKKAPTADQPRQISAEAREAAQDDELPVAESHQAYAQSASMPDLLFQQLHDRNLFARSLGGESFPEMLKFSDAQKLALVPERNAELAQAFRDLCSKAGRWAEPHFCRTATVTRQLLEPFNLESGLLKAAHIASLFYAFAYQAQSRSLLRKEYLKRGTIVLRKDLCSLLKDSALQLAVALNYPEASNVVATMGRLVAREMRINDEPITVAASAIMAADFTDRICFSSGAWNPRAAYSLIRRIKSGRMRDFHPAVLCCLVKFLCEAVSVSPPAHLLSKEVREDPKLQKTARETRDQQINENEKKVEIASLAPGMKLSRPLFAFDGRQILAEDLVLDQDLIWRIWQLSALRPLNAPVVVVEK